MLAEDIVWFVFAGFFFDLEGRVIYSLFPGDVRKAYEYLSFSVGPG